MPHLLMPRVLFGGVSLFCAWLVWNGYKEGFRRNPRDSDALNVLLPRVQARRIGWSQVLSGLAGLIGSLFALYQVSTLD